MFPLALVAAIVVSDHTTLRAMPHDAAFPQATLWRGDWVEVRGSDRGFLHVYDHRHERPGYVRPWQVHSYALDEASAPSLKAIAEFLRDRPGEESLAIAFAALYLKAAPAKQIGAGDFALLGTAAHHLARRARSASSPTGNVFAPHVEVAESYGVHFASLERAGRTLVCYDGDAFRQVLLLPHGAEEAATAALGLTDPDCVDPNLSAVDRETLEAWQRKILDEVPTELPVLLQNRVHLRRANLLSHQVFSAMRRDDGEGAQALSERSIHELALVDRNALPDEDLATYDETAIQVGTTRWASEATTKASTLHVEVAAGKPGERCIRLLDDHRTLAERCTYGIPWISSVRTSPRKNQLALVVQPLAGWSEVWIFRRTSGGATVDVLTPATTDPELGYVEVAGWSPDERHLLVVREARVDGHATRRFQMLRTDTLATEVEARSLDRFASFRRWQSPSWKASTLALR